MAINRAVWAVMLAGFAVWPGVLYADQCDKIFSEGAAKFDAALAAGQRRDFVAAVKLYGEAEQVYKRVAAMSDCQSPQIGVIAAHNVGICRSNASKIQQGMEKVDAVNREAAEADTYNQAASEYNRGVTAFNNNDWDAASDALESAAAIWESIASGTSKSARLAEHYAAKARKMAEQARKFKYQ
ncbi:MAG: hypothetical protein HGA80_00670 [Candidatus Omnitrophica bacterium]|nr:hypothetical protein [Candidatus Omnitrophota bacterium]